MRVRSSFSLSWIFSSAHLASVISMTAPMNSRSSELASNVELEREHA